MPESTIIILIMQRSYGIKLLGRRQIEFEHCVSFFLGYIFTNRESFRFYYSLGAKENGTMLRIIK